MEVKLEVVLSSSIKRKKPWPRFCWLGQEKESVFLLDDKRISEINMASGRTKKKTPKLYPFLSRVVTMAASQNGAWLCGLLRSGELFLWNRDRDLLKTAAAVPEVAQLMTPVQGNGSTRPSLQVSGDGMRVLLAALTGQVFLWECVDVRDLTGVRDGTVRGNWAHIQPLEDTALPSSHDKEASQHSIFVKTEAIGDTCLSAFVFTSGEKLTVTFLKIQWDEGHARVGSVGYNVQWASKTYPMSRLSPPCRPVKSRGALIPAFSPDGQLLAIVMNQRQPRATQVLFVSTQNFVSISSGLGGCGSKKLDIPSKYTRSYWVGSVSWSPGGLFLACVLKRGSLLMLARFGGLLCLSSTGCNVDFESAHFLPLHPLVTYRPLMSPRKGEASLSSSSMSIRDVLRQRYSVTWHPRLFYLIVSDGYMATVLRVLERPSPAMLLKNLLRDTSKDLERASRILEKSQIHARAWLESVSCLNLGSSQEELRPSATSGHNSTHTATSPAKDGSTLPLFLQDQGTMDGTKELLQKVQALFEDDSDLEGPPVGSHMEDSGHLEFASMFDTLHALLEPQTGRGAAADPKCERNFVDSGRKTPGLLRELGQIQGSLLRAWALGLSLGSTVAKRGHLLKHTLHCVLRFAALLHLIPNSAVHAKNKNISVSACLLHLLKTLLSFLPWDATGSDGLNCLGLVVELSKQMVCMLLSPGPESYQSGYGQVSSQSLSTALLILQLTSDSLNHTYSLQQRTVWTSSQQDSLQPSDIYHVPLLQDKEEKPCFVHQALPVPQRPSSRLLRGWQWVYRITLKYMEELRGYRNCDGWQEEQQQVSAILSQIQTTLQASGERLEEVPALLSYPGEHLYLFGFYSKSADVWRSEIWAKRTRSCASSVFQETRLCLALLYGLLSQYCLREAQGLGDHMARLMLHRAGHQKDNITCETEAAPCPWLPLELSSEAACAVIQTLGRFMASYFTNQPLYILPPHSVDILPPLHLPHGPNVGRLVPLCQERVAGAVRSQQLSEAWTVGYAQDLLLLGGLLPEAVWLAHHLGDWKTAAFVGVAYTTYCNDHCNFTRPRYKELHLPEALTPANIFEAQLESLLGRRVGSQEPEGDKESPKRVTDSLEGEDWELLQVSTQEILKASVMAEVNVMSSPLCALLDTAKDMCSCLPALVPSGLYLPAPPLYCPQPSPNTQDPIGTLGQLTEVASRHKVSGVLQRLLLLLRSARCCRPAAQWYISHLRRARHLLHKIKQKYSHPSAAKEERAFPEGLMKFVTYGGFFRRGPNGDGCLDPVTIQTIICFRELCALCWMLHVRDQLSVSCRKYQAARHHVRDKQIPDDSEVKSSCVDALHWACRFLPFSRFLNAEEILQDILLSLVSELPPVSLVAETLVRAFPQEEESVRVPLREKYSSLLQRLNLCTVLEGEKEESNELMMILVRDKLRQRRKDLLRLRRHLAPTELYLWEREEEEEDKGGRQGTAMLGQLSLGASLSNSTLTECGHPLVYSDADTAENTSEALSPDLPNKSITSSKSIKVQNREDAKRTAVKIKQLIQEESDNCPGPDKEDKGQNNLEQPCLPVVGTWEFELEDEEYLGFLELFLSYVLEKDGADGADSGCELPLLTGFCSQLRERELHSLTFDVLTTLRRRQRDGRHPPRRHGSSDAPVFRAGCCFKPIQQGTLPEPQTSSARSEPPISRTSLSVASLPGLRAGKQQGLFGLQQQTSVASDLGMKGNHLGSNPSTVQSSFLWRHPSECMESGSLTSMEAIMELQQGLDPKLEAQFPEMGRLLEWMARWADRRVVLGHHGKKKQKIGAAGDGEVADGRVVIRVKTSAPAVLTALSLLGHRYTAALQGTDSYSAHIQVPETHWTVAPVLKPEVGQKPERESSVDTGYPGSANTPSTLPDHNPQKEELSFGSHTDEPEQVTFQKIPLRNDRDQVAFDSGIRASSSQQPCLDELVVDETPEKKGKRSESETLRESSSFSVGDISGSLSAEMSLADLDVSEKDDSISSTTTFGSRESAGPSHPEPQSLPAVQPETGLHTELSDPTGVKLHNTSVASPHLRPQSSTATAPTAASTASDPLMQVVDASISTPPSSRMVQENSCFGQSNLNSTHYNVSSSYSTGFLPQPNLIPLHTSTSAGPQTQSFVPLSGSSNPQFSQAPAYMSADQPAIQSSVTAHSVRLLDQHPATRTLHSAASSTEENYQDIQPLSVQAESPESLFGQSRRSIPCSQGLLTMVGPSQPIPTAPLVLPTNVNTHNMSAPHVMGLKLLQPQGSSHCPSVPEAWGLQSENKPPHAKLKLYDQATPKRAEEEKRRESSVPRRRHSVALYTSPPRDPAARGFLPQDQMSEPLFERSRRQEVLLLPRVVPATRPLPTQGLRLLHFHPDPHPSKILPQVSLPSSSRPSTNIAIPMACTPRIKLLHIDPEPKLMLPLSAPPAQMARLIPLEELTGSAVGRQQTGVQLLSVDPPAECTEKTMTSASSNSSRRQKKRVEKMRKAGKKAAVTFRPNESIIPTQEPAEEPVNEEPPADGVESTLGEDFAIPKGSFDSLLTGQRLLDKAMSTAAELHAFASTHKKPPESHDAFTNTDPVCPPTLLDKAVSARASLISLSPESQSLTAALPPSLFENSRFPREPPVCDTEEMPQETEKSVDVEGRQFISVIDLEDQALHQDLPPCLGPTVQDVPAAQPSSPTSAQLHLHALSVIRADIQPSVTDTEDRLEPTTQPEIPEVSPSPSGMTATQQDKVGPSEAFGPQKTQSCGSSSAFSTHPEVQFSARLSEMDAQLAALQKIADNMKMDFSSCKMLVNSIELRKPALAPDVENKVPLNKTVSLSVPLKAWRARPYAFTEPHACKEDEEKPEEDLLHNDSSAPQRQPSGLFSNSADSQRAGPSCHHAPSKMNDQSDEASGPSGIWADEILGQSGLSDVADILAELVREGALSPTDLDLSSSQEAHPNSRLNQQQGGWTPENHVPSEDEREQLRIWMRRKQRERLAVYKKQRERMREREYRPYSTALALKSSCKNQAGVWKTKEEKDKMVLLEQYNLRTSEAWSVISDCPASPPTLPRSSQPEAAPFPSSIRPATAQTSGSMNSYRNRSPSADDKRRGLKSQSGQAQPHFSRSKSAEVQGGRLSLESQHRRFGLHRPVSSLPRDRLSQVTRRGMLTDMKSKAESHTASQYEQLHKGHQRKAALSRSPSGRNAVGREIGREQREREEREAMSSWKPPPETYGFLGPEESQSELGVPGLPDDQEDGARGGASEMDWLENLSDSTGSILSKIDWAAIERIVAAEGAV
ncbi:ciliogenesis and planar polarity effector 1 isoform X2 [Myripristis murdjan]|uniref:ciliogenesis and planar polarity effector 1 isoform X2 n=1 Tax=Myripristis murdjan TaxID=586833 RepID=UPI0011761B22|nr:ciliogenesis and planar polarity effector 1 isoform X2 [Myripristis murdjan]